MPCFERLDTKLDGPLPIVPAVSGDARGFFSATYRANEFAELGVTDTMVQDNHSRSRYGTIRGMRFHIGAGCSKLVGCVRGTIVDLLVDPCRDSSSYGQWEAYELSDENMRVLFAPVGFGHGFAVTSEIADVVYTQSAYYDTDVERGISFMDPALAIEWPVPREDWAYAERDAGAPTFEAASAWLPF